jgi:hypothetical protein
MSVQVVIWDLKYQSRPPKLIWLGRKAPNIPTMGSGPSEGRSCELFSQCEARMRFRATVASTLVLFLSTMSLIANGVSVTNGNGVDDDVDMSIATTARFASGMILPPPEIKCERRLTFAIPLVQLSLSKL